MLLFLQILLISVTLGHAAPLAEENQCRLSNLAPSKITTEHINALRAAPRVVPRNVFLTKESVAEGVYAIYKADPSLLTRRQLDVGRADRILTAHFGTRRRGATLASKINEFHGSLKAFVEQLGLPHPGESNRGKVKSVHLKEIPEGDALAAFPPNKLSEAETWVDALLSKDVAQSFIQSFHSSDATSEQRQLQLFRGMNFLRVQARSLRKSGASEAELESLEARVGRFESALLRVHGGYRNFLGFKYGQGELDKAVADTIIDKAMLRAVQKFDPSKGRKFGPYAAIWVRSMLSQARKYQEKDQDSLTNVREAEKEPSREQNEMPLRIMDEAAQARSVRIQLLNLYESQPDAAPSDRRLMYAEIYAGRKGWRVRTANTLNPLRRLRLAAISELLVKW